VTGRMTHSRPNVAQTPANHALYGEDCRSCFTVSDAVRYSLVGCDAEGLELRCLGHFMARWDGGAYANTVINGRKEDETDVHSVNRKAAGLNTRDSAKTFIYALIYGAGDFKLGTTVYEDFTDLQKQQFLEKYKTKRDRQRALTNLGKARRDRIMDNLPALAKLVEAVRRAWRKNGHLVGLDGRLLHVRSEHAALNTLLQSAGAIVMKKALVLFEDDYASGIRLSHASHMGAIPIIEYCANVHDEVQLEALKEIADDVGKEFAECIRRAGEHYKFRCPLSGSYAVGTSWAETH
jgi:DNA polymerase-1